MSSTNAYYLAVIGILPGVIGVVFWKQLLSLSYKSRAWRIGFNVADVLSTILFTALVSGFSLWKPQSYQSYDKTVLVALTGAIGLLCAILITKINLIYSKEDIQKDLSEARSRLHSVQEEWRRLVIDTQNSVASADRMHEQSKRVSRIIGKILTEHLRAQQTWRQEKQYDFLIREMATLWSAALITIQEEVRTFVLIHSNQDASIKLQLYHSSAATAVLQLLQSLGNDGTTSTDGAASRIPVANPTGVSDKLAIFYNKPELFELEEFVNDQTRSRELTLRVKFVAADGERNQALILVLACSNPGELPLATLQKLEPHVSIILGTMWITVVLQEFVNELVRIGGNHAGTECE